MEAPLHRWDVTPAEAIAIQRELRARVRARDDRAYVGTVAGVDVGFEEEGRIARAAVAVLSLPSLEPVAEAVARAPTAFPYVPGLLSFREVPVVAAALARLAEPPDVILCDGQGYAHPRRFGLACHLGVWTGLPTVGVAKTRLVGEHGAVPEGRGEWCPLTDAGEVIGAVLRTRRGVRPLYVSVGHRVSLTTAIELVMRCVTRYRLPETTRRAHRLASG
ncbi:MAG: deoxyribonuclease V [Gammaproteobacteria bacterium]|jgi:deoxyribonuclease V|nr:deoxyribonuclease V [Gammaproteobacteria bacterium]